MKTKQLPVLLFFVVFMLACSKVPITGRKQLHLLPESQLIGMSVQQYAAFCQRIKKSMQQIPMRKWLPEWGKNSKCS